MRNYPLDIYDDMPPDMKIYISYNGWHFTKKACDIAVRGMKKKSRVSGKVEKIEPYTKEKTEELLAKYGIRLENCVMYDPTYVLNMAYSDYYKSSIPDEQHLAMFVKDYLDDEDASDETAFRRWVATMVGNGEPIDWGEML